MPKQLYGFGALNHSPNLVWDSMLGEKVAHRRHRPVARAKFTGSLCNCSPKFRIRFAGWKFVEPGRATCLPPFGARQLPTTRIHLKNKTKQSKSKEHVYSMPTEKFPKQAGQLSRRGVGPPTPSPFMPPVWQTPWNAQMSTLRWTQLYMEGATQTSEHKLD